MQILPLLVLVVSVQGPPPDVDFHYLRDAVLRGNKERVASYFVRRADAERMFSMADARGGLRSIKVSMIPSPPGWEQLGPFWVIFHTRQDIEDDHDYLFGFVRSGSGYEVGREIPEWTGQAAKIKHLAAQVKLIPNESKAIVTSALELEPWSGKGALVFRLNDNFVLKGASIDGSNVSIVDGDSETIPPPTPGAIFRAGSLVVVWMPSAPKTLSLTYEGFVKSDGEDKIASNAAYLTAWWTPSIARQPHTTEVKIDAPADWHVVSEGVEVAPRSFRCDIPISYPKVIGGPYKLAAEGKDAKGHVFRSYQFEPIEEERAKRDVALMLEACEFYERTLGDFPFPGYSCYDADTYYGIESYSYTLLIKRNTSTFVTHEMGHTYFGGLVPSAYVQDSWNEGMTQYIDSVVFRNNRDNTLQNALRTMGVKVPLSQMPIAHSYGSTTYWRGAYAMKMLEAEIGQDKVLEALREIVKDRRGRDTTWRDLRPYFEKAGGQDLRWFWSQWIENAMFPNLRVVSAQLIPRDGKFSTFVTVEQTGTSTLFRLRFRVKVRSSAGLLGEKTVELGGNRDTYRIDTDSKPTEALIDVFPLALAKVGEAVSVRT